MCGQKRPTNTATPLASAASAGGRRRRRTPAATTICASARRRSAARRPAAATTTPSSAAAWSAGARAVVRWKLLALHCPVERSSNQAEQHQTCAQGGTHPHRTDKEAQRNNHERPGRQRQAQPAEGDFKCGFVVVIRRRRGRGRPARRRSRPGRCKSAPPHARPTGRGSAPA